MAPWRHERLEGRVVILDPLREEHFDGLLKAAADREVWRWMSVDGSRPDRFRDWFDSALSAENELPFAILILQPRGGTSRFPRTPSTGPLFARTGGFAAGSTRFLALAPEHRRVEIGHTWLARSHWGTGANAEAKLLMLEYAFERLCCRRVEFKTDALNERSRAALAALPAQFEGIQRKHMLVRRGESRDSAWYSVVDDDWPAVRRNLERRLRSAR